MLDMINDIEKAAAAGAYRSALALALTIPDIGGQIAFPECDNIGSRYRRWFNGYVKKYFPENRLFKTIGIKKFDAYACYKLRCAFLHSGNSVLEDVDYIQTLDFFIHRDEKGFLEDKTVATFVLNSDDPDDLSHLEETYTHIRLNIAKLCYILCLAGKEFCADVRYASSLAKFDIHIYDALDEMDEDID